MAGILTYVRKMSDPNGAGGAVVTGVALSRLRSCADRGLIQRLADGAGQSLTIRPARTVHLATSWPRRADVN